MSEVPLTPMSNCTNNCLDVLWQRMRCSGRGHLYARSWPDPSPAAHRFGTTHTPSQSFHIEAAQTPVWKNFPKKPPLPAQVQESLEKGKKEARVLKKKNDTGELLYTCFEKSTSTWSKNTMPFNKWMILPETSRLFAVLLCVEYAASPLLAVHW